MRMTTRILEGARPAAGASTLQRKIRPNAAAPSLSIARTPSKSASELLARDILVDYRPLAGIRISPHFYNQDEECDFALAQIEEILNIRRLGKTRSLFRCVAQA